MLFSEYEQAQFRLSKYVNRTKKFVVFFELSGNVLEWAVQNRQPILACTGNGDFQTDRPKFGIGAKIAENFVY